MMKKFINLWKNHRKKARSTMKGTSSLYLFTWHSVSFNRVSFFYKICFNKLLTRKISSKSGCEMAGCTRLYERTRNSSGGE